MISHKTENVLYQWQIEIHKHADSKFKKTAFSTLELLKGLNTAYLSKSDIEKVKLVKIVLSNLTLKDGNLSYDYKNPFSFFAKGNCRLLKWSTRGETRTFNATICNKIEVRGNGSNNSCNRFYKQEDCINFSINLLNRQAENRFV